MLDGLDQIEDSNDEIEHVVEGEENEQIGVSEKGSDDEKDRKEDIQVTKKITRKTGRRVVLNVERLKGPRGIGVMEQFFSDIKLHGKGREREDLDLVMGRLEHWAHRLFPRGQFDDCLKKIEHLGSKKLLNNYMKRIRLGLEEDGDLEDTPLDDAPESPPPPEDIFDQLLSSSVPSTTVNPDMTSEQREQMLQNRRIAEERRAARIKKAQEMKEKFLSQQTQNNQITDSQTLECRGENFNSQKDHPTTQVEVSQRSNLDMQINLDENEKRAEAKTKEDLPDSTVDVTGLELMKEGSVDEKQNELLLEPCVPMDGVDNDFEKRTEINEHKLKNPLDAVEHCSPLSFAPEVLPPPEDVFDQLFSSSVPSTTVNRDMTCEQRELMLQNRLIAEERRAARIKKAQEMKEKFLSQQNRNSQIANSQTLESREETFHSQKDNPATQVEVSQRSNLDMQMDLDENEERAKAKTKEDLPDSTMGVTLVKEGNLDEKQN